MFSSAWIVVALFVMPMASFVQAALGGVVSDGTPEHIEPVWSMGVADGRAVVLRSEMESRGLTFPLPVVRLFDLRRPLQNGTPMRVPYVAVVPISPKGQPMADPEYLPYRSVAKGANGSEPVVVVGVETTGPLSRAVSSFDPLAAGEVKPSDYIEWIPTALEGTGLLLATTKTVVCDQGEPVLTIPHRAYEGAFARLARVGAVCVFHYPEGSSEPDPWGNSGRLIVFDLNGNVLREVAFERGHGLSSLYLSNDGAWVVATEQGSDVSTIASDRVLWIDVGSGRKGYLPGVAGGYRLHSDDGEYMAEVQGGWGSILKFSMAVPSTPVKVSEYKSESIVVSASINGDGSLMAALLSPRISRGGPRPEQRIVVLDRDMRIVAVAQHNPASGFGLTIVGDYLFAGFQTDERPRYDVISSSQHIDMFHLGGLR